MIQMKACIYIYTNPLPHMPPPLPHLPPLARTRQLSPGNWKFSVFNSVQTEGTSLCDFVKKLNYNVKIC